MIGFAALSKQGLIDKISGNESACQSTGRPPAAGAQFPYRSSSQSAGDEICFRSSIILTCAPRSSKAAFFSAPTVLVKTTSGTSLAVCTSLDSSGRRSLRSNTKRCGERCPEPGQTARQQRIIREYGTYADQDGVRLRAQALRIRKPIRP